MLFYCNSEGCLWEKSYGLPFLNPKALQDVLEIYCAKQIFFVGEKVLLPNHGFFLEKTGRASSFFVDLSPKKKPTQHIFPQGNCVCKRLFVCLMGANIQTRKSRRMLTVSNDAGGFLGVGLGGGA